MYVALLGTQTPYNCDELWVQTALLRSWTYCQIFNLSLWTC